MTPALLMLVWAWLSALGLCTATWMLVQAFADPEGGSRP
ncbi:MAG: hypothetical protein AVDCRST_MAG51-242 [uncultured Ramlibacter sp.]|uniref:Uncharacterized protein n=1 Tax=uncultured Ramlibacter sp. TaxID=260755 RepID=A0A6J4NL84_9BURK|nr:MAG: hypothetical protein AVDCRST_MAG51-242 [uncultured Ramlibacter sp.]